MDTAERAYRTRGKIQDRLIRARRLAIFIAFLSDFSSGFIITFDG